MYVTPIYGANTQYATRDETPLLSAKQYTNIQKITGLVLYCARAADPTVIMPLNEITTEPTKATEKNRRQQIRSWTNLPLILTPLSDITRQT
jgi:hypothetical protein